METLPLLPAQYLPWPECLSPQNSYVGNLMPKVMVLGDGAFGVIGHEGRALMNEISALIKETPQSSMGPSTM